MTGVSGHRRVSISFYQNLATNLPSIEEQKQMLSRVDKIEKKITILKNTQIDIIKEIDEIIKANLR